jgi:hypothetical protein
MDEADVQRFLRHLVADGARAVVTPSSTPSLEVLLAAICARSAGWWRACSPDVGMGARSQTPQGREDVVEEASSSCGRGVQLAREGPELFERALELRARYAFGWYDALIVAAALACGSERLLSEDLQHGQRIGRLHIVNPFAAG